MEFAIGGLAAMGACVFTNPLEVIKTRMQLQGELQKKGKHKVHYSSNNVICEIVNPDIISLPAPYDLESFGLLCVAPIFVEKLTEKLYTSVKFDSKNGRVRRPKRTKSSRAGTTYSPYTYHERSYNPSEVVSHLSLSPKDVIYNILCSNINIFHSGYVIAKNDGIKALQQGLTPALMVQMIMNGLRLGTYQFAQSRGLMQDEKGKLVFYKCLCASALGGCMGQFLASPFFLVKTHLQAQATSVIAVGHQHNHTGPWKALKGIYRENGIRGLFRGASASVPRILVGGPVQLTSFEYAKLHLEKYKYVNDRPLLKSFLGSMVGGLALTVVGTPFDLILTRIYNQPTDANGKGILYKNYMDCVIKIYKAEGALGFYKGIGPMYLRIGPHTVLCLIFWDQLKALQVRWSPPNELQYTLT